MELKNAKLIHQVFGVGSIMETTEKTITVVFDSDGSVRKLAYPMVFDHIAYTEDEDLQAQVNEDIEQNREQAAAALQARLADYAERYRPLTNEEKAAIKEQAQQEAREHREAMKQAARDAAGVEEAPKKTRKPRAKKADSEAAPKAEEPEETPAEVPAE